MHQCQHGRIMTPPQTNGDTMRQLCVFVSLVSFVSFLGHHVSFYVSLASIVSISGHFAFILWCPRGPKTSRALELCPERHIC